MAMHLLMPRKYVPRAVWRLFVATLLLPTLLSTANTQEIGEFFNYPASARDVALANSTDAIRSNVGGVFANPAAVEGARAIAYSGRFIPLADSNIYVHSGFLVFTYKRFTGFAGVRVAFSSAPDPHQYLNFNSPREASRMGTVGAAIAIARSVNLGLSGQFFQSDIPNYSQHFATASAGLQFHSGPFSLSFSGTALGHRTVRITDIPIVPDRTRLAIASAVRVLQNVVLLTEKVEFDKYGHALIYSLGSELRPFRFLSLRTGYETASLRHMQGKKENFAAGLGIALKQFELDYAIRAHSSSSNDYIHFLTLTVGSGARP